MVAGGDPFDVYEGMAIVDEEKRAGQTLGKMSYGYDYGNADGKVVWMYVGGACEKSLSAGTRRW